MRRVVAVYEIAAGALSLLDLAIVVAKMHLGPLLVAICGVMATLSAASIVVGVQLWRERPGAVKWSIVLQLAQSIQVSVAGVFAYSVRLALAVVVGFGDKSEGMSQPVHLVLGYGQGASTARLAVNVLALAAVVGLRARGSSLAPPATTLGRGTL